MLEKIITLIISCTLLLTSSISFAAEKKVKQATMTIQQHQLTEPLFFSGQVQPLSVVEVPSPANGTVIEKHFKYGQVVKKGEELVAVESTEQQRNFHSALASYLQAKNRFNVAKARFVGSTELWELGIISKNEYVTERNTMESAHLAFLQALYQLEDKAKEEGHTAESIRNLEIKNIERVNKILKVRTNKLIVRSPRFGVVLLPEGSGSDVKKINEGMKVKQGDPLVSVGDLSGLSVTIKVNEIDINRIKPGMKAKVTGVAFPSLALKAHVANVDAQAKGQQFGGGSPSFTVKVVVDELTEVERKKIHVGMSAKVEIDLVTKSTIMVPITAVFQQNGKSFVNKKVAGKETPAPVITGKTTVDKVQIVKGLKTGDVIITAY